MNDLVKRCLKTALYPRAVTHALVDRVQLEMAVKQVADMLNSQPLMYLPAEKTPEILIPNHFLHPVRPHPSDVVEVSLTAIEPSK